MIHFSLMSVGLHRCGLIYSEPLTDYELASIYERLGVDSGVSYTVLQNFNTLASLVLHIRRNYVGDMSGDVPIFDCNKNKGNRFACYGIELYDHIRVDGKEGYLLGFTRQGFCILGNKDGCNTEGKLLRAYHSAPALSEKGKAIRRVLNGELPFEGMSTEIEWFGETFKVGDMVSHHSSKYGKIAGRALGFTGGGQLPLFGQIVVQCTPCVIVDMGEFDFAHIELTSKVTITPS